MVKLLYAMGLLVRANIVILSSNYIILDGDEVIIILVGSNYIILDGGEVIIILVGGMIIPDIITNDASGIIIVQQTISNRII